ncbi:COG3014 family protein [Marinobacter sp.]|uniref:COG3014 family protein n=1 Tax=Marinobacter sp. TaxID=50741 RepID=UPI00384B32A7
MKLVSRFSLILVSVLIVSGCSSFQHRDQMASFNAAYGLGNYDSALETVTFETSDSRPVNPEERLLELLHQGEIYRLQGRNEQSVQSYDLAEAGMKYLDTGSLVQEAGEGFMALMVNDSQRNYRALMSEAVLVNTYKGLAFLAAGNSDYARIEFNRANDRTRRAVDYFSAEIAAQQAALAGEAAKGGKNRASMVQKSLRSDELQETVSRNYTSSWSVFPEFIVPVSSYLHGLYFLANALDGSDLERTATSLKRVAEMQSDSAVLAADAELAVALASGDLSRADLAPQVWVIYENGLGPVLEESRIDVPLFLFTDGRGPLYFSIALPSYAPRPAVPGNLLVLGDKGTAVETERISDMGTVINTEVKERLSGVIARAVTSATIKAVIQNEAAEQFGALGQIGAAIFSIATTQADLRGWQALPNHWQAVRMDRPDSGTLTLAQSSGSVSGTIQVPDQPFTLVYVKRPTVLAPATVITMDLQGRRPASLTQIPRSTGPAAASAPLHHQKENEP